MMLLYDVHPHMSTLMKEQKKRLFNSDGAADLRSEDRPAACGCRTSGPAGAKEEKSLQRSHRDGK